MDRNTDRTAVHTTQSSKDAVKEKPFTSPGDAMRDLNFELKQLCQRNRDGSYAKQAARERILTQLANQLEAMGFHHLKASGLKPKHVEALVARMQADGLSVGTIKNRMCEVRWWAEKIGKQNVVAQRNDHYGIADRVFVTNISKAWQLADANLAKVADPYTVMSLRLQAAFGLRREESIKIRPAQADGGDRLKLQASWTKGGRPRAIPITTAGQRRVLDEAKQLAGAGSLIPADKFYVQQLKRFEYQCGRAGIDHVHGLRHDYAQRRYAELTGWPCPAAGGPTSKRLTKEQRLADRAARGIISAELGHEREQVTAIYLGR
jgi:site-specific recombinase XerC